MCTLKDISASQEHLCHLLSKNYNSACAICWENIILHSHPETEISFKFIPKILMSKSVYIFLGHSVCRHLNDSWNSQKMQECRPRREEAVMQYKICCLLSFTHTTNHPAAISLNATYVWHSLALHFPLVASSNSPAKKHEQTAFHRFSLELKN